MAFCYKYDIYTYIKLLVSNDLFLFICGDSYSIVGFIFDLKTSVFFAHLPALLTLETIKVMMRKVVLSCRCVFLVFFLYFPSENLFYILVLYYSAWVEYLSKSDLIGQF